MAEEAVASGSWTGVGGEDEGRDVAAFVVSVEGRQAVFSAFGVALAVGAFVPGDEDDGASGDVAGELDESFDPLAEPVVGCADGALAVGAGCVRGLMTAVGGAVVAMLWSATAVAAPRPMATWQTNAPVRAIRISNGVIYLGGDFTGLRPPGEAAGVDTVSRAHAAAIDASTGRLLRWNPRVNGRVNAIEVVGKRVYLGGNFTSVGGRGRPNVAAVGRCQGHVKPWNPGADDGVHVIKVGSFRRRLPGR